MDLLESFVNWIKNIAEPVIELYNKDSNMFFIGAIILILILLIVVIALARKAEEGDDRPKRKIKYEDIDWSMHGDDADSDVSEHVKGRRASRRAETEAPDSISTEINGEKHTAQKNAEKVLRAPEIDSQAYDDFAVPMWMTKHTISLDQANSVDANEWVEQQLSARRSVSQRIISETERHAEEIERLAMEIPSERLVCLVPHEENTNDITRADTDRPAAGHEDEPAGEYDDKQAVSGTDDNAPRNGVGSLVIENNEIKVSPIERIIPEGGTVIPAENMPADSNNYDTVSPVENISSESNIFGTVSPVENSLSESNIFGTVSPVENSLSEPNTFDTVYPIENISSEHEEDPKKEDPKKEDLQEGKRTDFVTREITDTDTGNIKDPVSYIPAVSDNKEPFDSGTLQKILREAEELKTSGFISDRRLGDENSAKDDTNADYETESSDSPGFVPNDPQTEIDGILGLNGDNEGDDEEPGWNIKEMLRRLEVMQDENESMAREIGIDTLPGNDTGSLEDVSQYAFNIVSPISSDRSPGIINQNENVAKDADVVQEHASAAGNDSEPALTYDAIHDNTASKPSESEDAVHGVKEPWDEGINATDHGATEPEIYEPLAEGINDADNDLTVPEFNGLLNGYSNSADHGVTEINKEASPETDRGTSIPDILLRPNYILPGDEELENKLKQEYEEMLRGEDAVPSISSSDDLIERTELNTVRIRRFGPNNRDTNRAGRKFTEEELIRQIRD